MRAVKPHPEKRAGPLFLFWLAGLLLLCGDATAAARFARTSGNWTTVGTWSSSSCAVQVNTAVPTAADDVTICPGITVTMDGNPGAALSMTIDGTANWTLARTTNVGAGGIVINGNVTGAVNGFLTTAGGIALNNVTLTSNTVTLRTQTTAGQSVTGTGSLARLAINATTTNNATLTVRTALSGTSTLTNAAGQTLNLGGATTTITGLTAVAANNVVNYYAAGNQTLRSATTTYHHLTLSGSGTKSTGAITLQVNGTTTVTGTATFRISSTTGTKTFVGPVAVNANCSWTNTANELVTFRGGITHNGATFSAGTGTQTFDTNSQALAGGSAMTFGGPVALTGAITLTNTVTSTLTISGNLNGSAPGSTFVNAANATLNYGGANVPMTTGILTAGASPNTVNYLRAGNQTVKLPSAGYHHLTLSTSGTKTAPAGTLAIAGNLTVNAGPTFTANTNNPIINVTGNATINGIYASSNNAARALTIGGNLGVAGTYTGNGAPVNLAGNFTRSGTFTSGTGSFTFNGSALQTLTGASTFTTMVLNNTGAGLSLASDITASTAAAGTLTLTAGTVTTGANTLIVSRPCTAPSVVRTGGWVAGNLRLQFPTGAPTCTFHVGDASNYRPIVTAFASVATAGSLTGAVSQAAGDHGSIASSGLDAMKSVNRYWTLSNPAGGTIVFTTYTATFNFINPGDFDVGATPTSFEIERWSGAAWSATTLGAAGATSTSASALPAIAAGSGNDFAIGEKKGPTVVSIVLASPDPTAPASSVDWTVTFSASVTGVDSGDFALVMGGAVSGATITGVAGSGTTWTVTANTGSGAGTLGLDLNDDDTIINASLKPLGGTGAGNGNFSGAVYTVVSASSGFVFTSSSCTHNVAFGTPGQCALVVWTPQVAGQNSAGVYITAINTSGIPTRLHPTQNRTRDIEFGLSCHDPVANAGRQATFAGATLPLCQASGATPTTWSPTVVVSFPGGVPSSNVSYTFNYPDVGSVELWMRNSAATTQTGSSGAFVVKPWGFLLAATCADTTVNAADQTTPSTADPKFCRAGQNFNVTATAITQAGSATPNYGKETTPETVAAAWSRQLPASGADGTLPSGSLPYAGSGGVFGPPVTPFTWDEVGILKAVLTVGDGNYRGAGNVSSTAYVGRFYPDHFDVALTPPPGCTGAVYAGRAGTPVTLGQPFTVVATAKNGKASPTTTTNYNTTAGFSKNVNLTLTAGGTGVGKIYVDSTQGGAGAIPSGNFTGGIGTVNYNDASGKISYVFDTFPTTATNIAVHADDAETVTSPMVAGTDGTASARSGRLQIENMYGPPNARLATRARALYWDGTKWALNTADNCTETGDMALKFEAVVTAACTNLVTPLSSSISVTGGEFRLVLPPPSGSGRRCVSIQKKPLLGYLDGNTAKQTWGSFRAPYIYQRER